MPLKRLSKTSLAEGARRYPRDRTLPPRPRTWGDCKARDLGTPQSPCPYFSCTQHLLVDVTETGGITLNRPGESPDEALVTCTLRVAERGPLNREQVGALLNLTRQGMQRVETIALANLTAALRRLGFTLADLEG